MHIPSKYDTRRVFRNWYFAFLEVVQVEVPVLRIRIRSDPKLFAGSESEVGQPGPGMKMKQNFSDKILNIST
jgi:hypothetical protein